MTKKVDDRIAELEKENQKLREDQISQMFNSIITLIKTENEKVLSKIEVLSEKHNNISTRQLIFEEKIIPEIQKELEHLKNEKNLCPVTTGAVKKDFDTLVTRVNTLEKETVVARDMFKYPKVTWALLILICTVGSSAGLFYFIEKFFLK